MLKWKEYVRKVTPYVPGEQPDFPDMIKLNTNENPYPPSPKVAEKLKALDADQLRLYPDCAAELVHAVAHTHGLKDEQVFVGIGSDDVLALSFMTFFNSDKPILFPDITYSFYDVWANLLRVPYEQPALDENFAIVPEDYFKENGGIIFPNPNAPSGVEMSLDAVEEIIKKNQDVVVIIDEAYIDFASEGITALPLIEKYDNLLVIQTFSKSRSMAGMRIGFAMGNPELIKCLNEVKYSFNSYTMDYTAIELGVEAVNDTEYLKKTAAKIVATREWTQDEMRKLGFRFQDSKTNFIFVEHESCPAPVLQAALREAHIYVRYFNRPRIDNYLRITIGTQEEMETFISFLKKYFNQ